MAHTTAEAFLFDLDGTLLDSEILWVESVHRVLAERGVSLADREAMELVYGRSWHDIYESIRLSFPGVCTSRTDMETATGRIYKELQARTEIRIHSSIALLEQLAARFPVAIVSGSTRETIADGIRFMGIESHVRLFVGAEDYAAGKPDPACFLLAARLLAVRPEACVVFEDSNAGVCAAKAAGMTCIALQRSDRPAQDMSMADEVLGDLAEFTPERYCR